MTFNSRLAALFFFVHTAGDAFWLYFFLLAAFVVVPGMGAIVVAPLLMPRAAGITNIYDDYVQVYGKT